MRKLLLLIFVSVAAVATGQATYTYTGHIFNSVASAPVSISSIGTHVTATVTLPMALPKGATTCIASLAPPCSSPAMNLNGYSWSISDGANVIGNSYPARNNGAILVNLTFTTDSNGNIINWNMDASNSYYNFLGAAAFENLEIRTTHEPGPGFENDSDLSSVAYYLDSISSSPGSWAMTDPQMPMVIGAAGYSSIAPGGLATIYGDFSGFPTLSGLATVLGGVRVTFPGIADGGAPLLYVSPEQISFQVPWELQGVASNQQTQLSVNLNGKTVAGFKLSPLPSAAPGIFEMNAGHQAAVVDSSGQLVGASNPTSAGAVISIYCTGLGPVNVPQADGSPAPLDKLVYTNSLPSVTIGGNPAQVLFSGLAPGATGLYQVNVIVPNVTPGSQSLVIQTLNVASNTTMIAVQ